MNYLAHLYLAGNNAELLVGNFIADAIKGNKYKNYTEGISKGIVMHRAIDDFADSHPVYLNSVHRLRPKHGKFSGVIMDMFFDHLLAANWKDFSDVPLEKYSENIYTVLKSHQSLMPEESRMILTYMSKHNWLLSYRNTSGIRRALHGMSQRMKYYNPMDEAVSELETNIAPYQADFNSFFPLIQTFVRQFY